MSKRAFRFTCSDDGRHVYDGDFGYDVRMDIDGDWPSDQERVEYAQSVCRALSDNPPPTADSAQRRNSDEAKS